MLFLEKKFLQKKARGENLKAKRILILLKFLLIGLVSIFATDTLPTPITFYLHHSVESNSSFYFSFTDFDQPPNEISTAEFEAKGTHDLARFAIYLFGNKSSSVSFTSITLKFTALENTDPNITAYCDYTLHAKRPELGSIISTLEFNETEGYSDKSIEFVDGNVRTFTKTISGITEQIIYISDLSITFDGSQSPLGTYSATVTCYFDAGS